MRCVWYYKAKCKIVVFVWLTFIGKCPEDCSKSEIQRKVIISQNKYGICW